MAYTRKTLLLLVVGTCLNFCSFVIGNTTYASPTKTSKLTPHKATYDISMTAMHSGSQIVNVTGTMEYEWYPDCEGWISSHQFDVLYEYADSPALRTQSNFSTYESFDGKEFGFSSIRKRNDTTIEKLRGHADINAETGGQAIYINPETITFDLPQNTQFPIAHTLNILEAFNTENRFYNSFIFDGSDVEGGVEVNAFIGKYVVPSLKNISHTPEDQTLLTPKARKIRLAFFPIEEEDSGGESDYEMDVILHENGVISDMNIEYDSFSIRQKLSAIETKISSCNKMVNF